MGNKVKLYGIKENGEKSRIVTISMGQSYTRINVENETKSYNSIVFVKFVDEDDNEIDIYKSFNPYRKGTWELDLEGVIQND